MGLMTFKMLPPSLKNGSCMYGGFFGAPGKRAPRFNCQYAEVTNTDVHVVMTADQAQNRTKLIKLNLITNSMPVDKDEELFLKVEPKPKAEPKKRSWKDLMKKEEQEQAKEKADGKGKKPRPSD